MLAQEKKWMNIFEFTDLIIITSTTLKMRYPDGGKKTTIVRMTKGNYLGCFRSSSLSAVSLSLLSLCVFDATPSAGNIDEVRLR